MDFALNVIPQCLVTDRIPIKLQLTGKSCLIFKFFIVCHIFIKTEQRTVSGILQFCHSENATRAAVVDYYTFSKLLPLHLRMTTSVSTAKCNVGNQNVDIATGLQRQQP